MKKIQPILTTLISFLIGGIGCSFYLTGNENYKVYIPIALVLFLIKHIISEIEAE